MASEKIFENGTVIFNEGVLDLTMYDIITGKVGIYVNYGKDNEKLLTELTAGKYFGEMGVIDSMPRSATAVALEDTKVNVIDKSELADFFKDNPAIGLEICRNLSGRLRELSKDYIDACNSIAEYVENQKDGKAQKPGLLAKIKRIIEVSAEYYVMYNTNAETYPYFQHNGFYY